MNNILEKLKELDGKVTSQIIKDLIKEHETERKKMIGLYERYKSTKEGVPIHTRVLPDSNKVNNKLANDFMGDIVDTKVGYFAGNPISYDIDQKKEDPKYKKDIAVVNDFNIRNNIEDLDSETAKMMAICGQAARLLYVDLEGKERVMLVPPWEVIFISDRSVDEYQFALRYYDVWVKEATGFKKTTRVEWYDQKLITFYILRNGEYVEDDTESENPKPHLFGGIPLFLFYNNQEKQGDCEKVLSLIDAYDRTLSDVNSEIEQFRLAYMYFKGMSVDEEVIAKARQTGAFEIDEGEGCDAGFLTKELKDSPIENHLNRLDDNILKFAKSVNFSDESFGTSISGIAMRFKLFALESKCIVAERKMTTGLRRMFQLLCNAWNLKGHDIDYTQIFFSFKRNVPINLLDEAETTAKLRGHVSESTRLSLLSFVDDVNYEMKLMQKENENSIDLDDKGGSNDE